MTPPPVKVEIEKVEAVCLRQPVTGGGVPPPVRRGGPAYVYLIRSLQNGQFYLGATRDIEGRLDQHNHAGTRFTRQNRPWILVGYESYSSFGEARKRELKLKRNPNMYFHFKKRLLNGQVVG